jgi:hypothetical protein
MTDSDGTFTYYEGDVCSFYVGDILIGEGKGKPYITPLDLVPGANDETDEIVTNICRFLVTLDSDSNPYNGITIPGFVHELADYEEVDFSSEQELQTVISNLTHQYIDGPKELESERVVQFHLFGTTNEILSRFAGVYSGNYFGDESGPVSVAIDRFGTITGIHLDHEYSNFCEGSVTSDGDTIITAGKTTDNDTTFAGFINENYAFYGTWEDVDGDNGTFELTRISNDPISEIYIDNSDVLVLKMPYAMSDPRIGRVIGEELLGITTTTSLALAIEGAAAISCPVFWIVAGVHLAAGGLKFWDELYQPLRMVPLAAFLEQENDMIQGVPYPILENDRFSAIVFLDFIDAQWAGSSIDLNDFTSDLTLRIENNVSIEPYETIFLLSQIQLQNLDINYSYLILPKKSFDVDDVEMNVWNKDVTIIAEVGWRDREKEDHVKVLLDDFF